MKKMVGLVDELRDSLYDDNLDGFGKILHKNWLLKKQLASKISNSQIDALYNKGLKAGAAGGKLLGAGGGGFLMFYCDGKHHASLRKAMSGMRELQFNFETEGSKVIYVGDEYAER